MRELIVLDEDTNSSKNVKSRGNDKKKHRKSRNQDIRQFMLVSKPTVTIEPSNEDENYSIFDTIKEEKEKEKKEEKGTEYSLFQKLKDGSITVKDQNITKFTKVEKLNEYEHNLEYKCSSTFVTGLMHQEINGKMSHRKKKKYNVVHPTRTLSEMLGTLQHVTPSAKVLITGEPEEQEKVIQQGANFIPSWNSFYQLKQMKSGIWRAIGGTPILSDQEVYHFNQLDTPHCTVQKFDPYGSLLASGYSYGEVLIHDFDEFSDVRQTAKYKYNKMNGFIHPRVDGTYSESSFEITNNRLNGIKGLTMKDKSGKEHLFPFQSTLLRFTPRTKKYIQSVQWSGEDSTLLSVSYRLHNVIEQFDLERCVESYTEDGTPAYADPVNRLCIPSGELGVNSTTPTDICMSHDNSHLLWSSSRDGKIRMWDSRTKNSSPTIEQAISLSEITCIQHSNDLLWTSNSGGKINAIDLRTLSGTKSISASCNMKSILCSYSPTSLLQTQSQSEAILTRSTNYICGFRFVDDKFIASLSGDGTVVLFDPFTGKRNRYTEFNNAKLLGFYQSSHPYTKKLFNANMLDIIPSSCRGNSLIAIPSKDNSFTVLDMFEENVDRAIIDTGFPITCLTSHPTKPIISAGYGSNKLNFGSIYYGTM